MSLLLVVSVTLLSVPLQAVAAPPASGMVVEGTSVPGGAIGDTRAEIESSFGAPSFCQSITAGDLAACTYNTTEGSVSVRYVGADGGNAQASSTDMVHGFNWSGYGNWATVAGVSTSSTPEEVVAAYPDATHTVGSFGFESVVSLELGLSWTKTVNPYFGTVRVSMSVFPGTSSPPDPDPDPDPEPQPGPTVSVDSLTLRAGRKAVTATAVIVDDSGNAISGAVVSATWSLPDGSNITADSATNRRGIAKLSVAGGSGVFSITIDDVVAEGYEFAGGEVNATIGG